MSIRDSWQYVQVEFRPHGRAYTYHWTGEPLAVGDEVKVPQFRDEWQRAKVVGFMEYAPPFATKAIMGKAPPIKESDDHVG